MNQLESIASSLSEGTEEQIKNNILLRRINSAVRSQLLHSKQLLAKANAECVLLQDQRKELLAALKLAEQWLQGWASADEELAVIRAVIAKAVKP